MRILGTIIRTLIVDVLSRQAEGSNGDVIGPEFIGCDPGGWPALFLQQLAHQLQRCLGVPLRLHEEIQDLAFIDLPPWIVPIPKVRIWDLERGPYGQEALHRRADYRASSAS